MDKIQMPASTLAGLKLPQKTTNEGGQSNVDCGSLWQKFSTEGIAARIQDKLGDDIYAVYFDYEGDHTQPFSYFIGCKIKMDTQPPEGLDMLVIPANSYVPVLAKGKMPDCIGKSWKEIWDSTIDRAYQFDFEVYDERSNDWNDAEVNIYISSR